MQLWSLQIMKADCTCLRVGGSIKDQRARSPFTVLSAVCLAGRGAHCGPFGTQAGACLTAGSLPTVPPHTPGLFRAEAPALC